MKKFRYEEMLPHEFLGALAEMPLFIIPTGLLEWHGDHNPLGLDTLKVTEICLRAAKRLGGGIVLPPNYYGRPGFSSYTGTLTYSEGCLHILFTELFGQLRKAGGKVIALITGHYGGCQVDFIKKVAANFEREHPDVRILAMPEYEDTLVDGRSPADHAGFWETSMMLAVDPALTDMNRLAKTPAPMKIYTDPPNDYYKESGSWTWDDSVFASDPETGNRALDAMAATIAAKIRALL